MGDVYEKRVLDLIFNNALASATTPMGLHTASVWVALGTAGADGSFSELPATGGYLRVAKGRTNTTDWKAAVGLSPATTTNNTVVTFPVASANWNSGNTITHFAIYDAASGGNVIYWADLPNPKVISIGDTASFPIDSITLTQD
jgi:hypothetical protein